MLTGVHMRVPQSIKNVTYEEKLTEIHQYCYQNVRISNTVSNLHHTQISHDCTIFINYFSTINFMRHVIDGDRRPFHILANIILFNSIN